MQFPVGCIILNSIAKALQNHDEFGVQFDENTDWAGSSLYNMKLSERRVNSAKNYLIGRGIQLLQFEIINFKYNFFKGHKACVPLSFGNFDKLKDCYTFDQMVKQDG